MKLVITEKPSVAQSIARVIGANKRNEGYLEGNGYLVSWCVGHLVELAPPQNYDERYAKWRVEDLPIVPREWLYLVSGTTKKQFSILRVLMGRKDVKSLICATDAGREGELIFRLVYNQCRCKKPFERLWISSMEDAAIREGFRNLKPGNEYDALYEAALCRERADWLVGMNGTRLFSCLYGQTMAVGRVMTPTLAMVVERDAQIASFKSEPFWTVELQIGDTVAASRRFEDKKEAEALTVCLQAGEAVVRSVETKEKLEKPPLLYDLTSLQRDANRMLGLTAQKTLNTVQSLYEKKLVTYPRTDSRYLTEDMKEMMPDLIAAAAKKVGYTGGDLQVDPVRPKAIFDSNKVSDHHAIVPTKGMAEADLTGLSPEEMDVLTMIAVRLLCAAAEDHRYAETEIRIECGKETFTNKGKQVVQDGWKGIFNHFYTETGEGDIKQNSVLTEGESYPVDSVRIKEGKTSPKKHFTEDTLLRSMETAGADEIPDDAERKGLGTPATRAATIEKLIKRGFVERQGNKKAKHLVATEAGKHLVDVMPAQLRSAAMTAEWEQKLLQVEREELKPETFMAEIEQMLSSLIEERIAEGIPRGVKAWHGKK